MKTIIKILIILLITEKTLQKITLSSPSKYYKRKKKHQKSQKFQKNHKFKKQNRKKIYKRKRRKLFFPGFEKVVEKLPKPFLITENGYGNIVGGNMQIHLPTIENPMVMNAFPTNQLIQRQPADTVYMRKINRWK